MFWAFAVAYCDWLAWSDPDDPWEGVDEPLSPRRWDAIAEAVERMLGD